MQKMIIERVRSLMNDGSFTRLLGWEEGEFFYDRTPRIFDKDSLDEVKYDSFCGSNLSKYLVYSNFYSLVLKSYRHSIQS